MNDLIPKGWEIEKQRIVKELIVDALTALVEQRRPAFVDTLTLLRKLKATRVVHKLQQISYAIHE